MDQETQSAINDIREKRNQDREDFVRLETTVINAVKSQDDIKKSISALDTKLDIIRQDIATARGSANAFKWLAETVKIGGAGGVGAWLASMFGGGNPPGA